MASQRSQRQITPTGPFESAPDGFVLASTPNGQQYLTPEFLIPATLQGLEASRQRAGLNVQNYAGLSENSRGIDGFESMIGPQIMMPADPHLTEREVIGIHAEVLALVNTLGISYKDASHRLYMAELQRLKAEERKFKTFRNLNTQLKASVEVAQTNLQILRDRPGRHSSDAADAVAGSKDADVSEPLTNVGPIHFVAQAGITAPGIPVRQKSMHAVAGAGGSASATALQ